MALFFPVALWLLIGIGGLYLVANLFVSVHLSIKEKEIAFLILAPVAFFIRHFAHGVGALVGLFLAILPGESWRLPRLSARRSTKE